MIARRESPSGALTSTSASEVSIFQPSGTMNVLPSRSAAGVSPVITLATGALVAGAGLVTAVGAGSAGAAGAVGAAGLGDDEHAASNTNHKSLRMRQIGRASCRER